MKIRVQHADGLWEIIEFPSGETRVLDLGDSPRNCIFAGSSLNHYFDKDGYYDCAGRSLESMRDTHSQEDAEEQVEQINSDRQSQDVLNADEIG